MNSSRNFSNRPFLLLTVCLLCLWICATSSESTPVSPSQGPVASIAVFPLVNLSGTAVPLEAIRESLISHLKAQGFLVLDDGTMERFMARYRIRYTGDVDEVTAQGLKKETGVDAVLITSVELFSEGVPPRVALSSRLVSTGNAPSILWADGVGLAGHDHPGILGMGLIDDTGALLKKALQNLVGSLSGHIRGQDYRGDAGRVKKKFQPKIVYRSPGLQPGKRYKVAIIPFFNYSDRKNGGDILALHFINGFHEHDSLEVLEPGLVRKAFLTLRIIMNEGLSLSDANALFTTLDVDMVMAGQVFDYQDYEGILGRPRVKFSAQIIEKRSQRMVWSSVSYNQGDDGVFFFDLGKVNTAHAMAAQMVQAIGDMLVKK